MKSSPDMYNHSTMTIALFPESQIFNSLYVNIHVEKLEVSACLVPKLGFSYGNEKKQREFGDKVSVMIHALIQSARYKINCTLKLHSGIQLSDLKIRE